MTLSTARMWSENDHLSNRSECIKIQPTDIQPDVFSYLLHIMYTGNGPKQPVDQGRLQDGIKFLHAYQLCHKATDGGPDASSDPIRISNLYGIQISSQLGPKESPGIKASGMREPEDRRCGARSRAMQAVSGIEGHASERQSLSLRAITSGDECDILARIKQEEEEPDEGEEPRASASLPSTQGSPCQAGGFKDGPLALMCPQCGERCLSPEGLQEHLFTHTACALMQGPSEDNRGDVKGLKEERQCHALTDDLASEIKRGTAGTGSPPAGFTRKRKMACAVCNLHFSQKSQLQEHMFAHVGKPLRQHRYGRFGGPMIHPSEGTSEIDEVAQDNGSSCYSLDSEVSHESVDAVAVE
ncbi:Zinc finger and BTB domain-containing protein 25 [Bagarius yarrelli]|uniref:Zinc finger and BTB domain-containing protein 25 n=1 Tax=Bagarius yarrelli TaxID=175774 RepID=A0A556V205_BAGYA|nr:Zinc finger and BTB domain-containing protein 25 [Bagarius yarrelli]